MADVAIFMQIFFDHPEYRGKAADSRVDCRMATFVALLIERLLKFYKLVTL